MGRITGLGWALVVAVVVTVALFVVAPSASAIAGIVLALLLLAAVTDAVGGSHIEPPPLGFEERGDRRRKALRRLSRDRDWDRRPPDVADEPAEAIWARERERGGLR
jgi:hypothetical protein